MFISTEFIMEYFSFCYGDCLEDIPGHVEDDKVAVSYMGSRVECGVGDELGGLGGCDGCHRGYFSRFEV